VLPSGCSNSEFSKILPDMEIRDLALSKSGIGRLFFSQYTIIQDKPE
jgi:hypothetical protein